MLAVIGSLVENSESCDQELDEVIKAVPQLDYLGITDAEGRFICRANNSKTGDIAVARYVFEALPTPEMPFVKETRSPEVETERYEAAVVVSYGIFEGPSLDRVVLAGFKLRELRALTDRSLLDQDTHIAIINHHGEALIGGRTQTPEKRLEWIDVVNTQGQYEGKIEDVDGSLRNIFVVQSGSDNLYVAMSNPESNIISWSQLNPFSSIIVPILAWLFGFVAIWLATDKLVLIHLRKMQRATKLFAKGNYDARVGTLNDPPMSIKTLGYSFDSLADTLAKREADIRDSLDEKETLLREIHHRVKNNLQIIISLLNMQERKSKSAHELDAITETRSRINAIALVHRGLYESTDLRYVNMEVFLNRLVDELSLALGMKKQNIQLDIKVNCEPMEADTATPVALFVVEALTNAVKHGVNHGGDVEITLTQKNENVTVSIQDNGTSFDENTQHIVGTGTKLIRGFARQLGGTIDVRNDRSGYKVSLDFVLRKEQK
jgi:two-component sensor histidine kinase